MFTKKQQRKEEIDQYRKEKGISAPDNTSVVIEGDITKTDVSFDDSKQSNKQKRVEAQWKLMTRLAIVRWRKANSEDKRDDAALAEQWMIEAQKEGWCRKNSKGGWELKELKLNKKEFIKSLTAM